jgi:serine/threonine-protein kinase
VSSHKESWNFEEGAEIVAGRRAIHLLGGGTRAEAWAAWDERLHTVVVVKVLRPDHVENAAALNGLAREARVLDELHHPAIVRCFDAVLDGPRPHLVLESLDGPRVSTLLRRYGPLAPEQVVPLGLEICSALAFMHNVGYLHLDIKPRNLIMGAAPRMIDLGIARRFDEMPQLHGPLGTDAYMAPEQCRVETVRSAGPPADVWGLGVTLYEAVAGRHPFKATGRQRDGTDKHPQLTHSAPPLDKNVPSDIGALILRCLEREPDARPTATQLWAELEPMLEHSRRSARRRLRARAR